MKSTPYQHEQISQSPRVQVSYDARTQAEQRCGVIVIRLSKHQEDNTTWNEELESYWRRRWHQASYSGSYPASAYGYLKH